MRDSGSSKGWVPRVRGSDYRQRRAQPLAMKMKEQRHHKGRNVSTQSLAWVRKSVPISRLTQWVHGDTVHVKGEPKRRRRNTCLEKDKRTVSGYGEFEVP